MAKGILSFWPERPNEYRTIALFGILSQIYYWEEGLLLILNLQFQICNPTPSLLLLTHLKLRRALENPFSHIKAPSIFP